MSSPLMVRALDRVLVALTTGDRRPDRASTDGYTTGGHSLDGNPSDGHSPDGHSPDVGVSGASNTDGAGGPGPSAERLVIAAQVLASWFGASLQFATTDDIAVEQLDRLAGTIGLRTDPIVVLPTAGFDHELASHALQHAPSLVVTLSDGPARSAARSCPQPTYLIPPGPKRRQPSGPLLVDPTPGEGPDEALALATVWALALDVPLSLITDDTPEAAVTLERDQARLAAMGVRLAPPATRDEAVARFGGDDMPLALVVAAAVLDHSSLVEPVIAAGGNVLAAPPPIPSRRRPDLDLNAVHDLSAALGTTSDDADELSAEECAEVLAVAAIGRVAYVDHGWPVVVPVNFSVDSGDIFIRSVRGGKLLAAARHDRVCFEADTVAAGLERGRSVIVHGHLEIISDPATLQAAWANEPSPWVDDDQLVWLRLIALATTGRRVG